ncbi:cupin domain-containing protein [Geoalkalibacter sp.]|uniref:cupin domain-containing protein n=1 Tax=Geoalkalibacter sp. TaxID=3041440 RepID=UPI00272DFA27|nr:cupin domain-containing protein [Geoalkalibacter sp.]
MTQAPYRITRKKVILETPEVRVSEMTLATGEEIPWHLHTEVADTFYCLEGRVLLQTGKDPQGRLYGPGDCHALPAGEPHRLSNAGEVPCRVLLIQGIGRYDFVATQPPVTT